MVVLHLVQEADGLQVLGRGHRQGQHVADGLVEARVGAVSEGHRLVLVLQEVLDVAHLVVHGDQVVHGYHRALLDPESGSTKKMVVMRIMTIMMMMMMIQDKDNDEDDCEDDGASDDDNKDDEEK